MKVVLTGASGLLGPALVASLRADGHDVLRLVRREPRAPRRGPVGPGRGHGRPGRARGCRRGRAPGRCRARRPAVDPGPPARGHGQPGAGHHDDRAARSAEQRRADSCLGVGRRLLRQPGRRGAGRGLAARDDATSPTSRRPGRPATEPAADGRRRGWCRMRTGGGALGQGRRATAGCCRSSGSGSAASSAPGGSGGRWVALDDYVRAVRFVLDHDDLGGPGEHQRAGAADQRRDDRRHGPRAAPADALHGAGVGAEGCRCATSPRTCSAGSASCPVGCWTPGSSSRTPPSSPRCARCWPRVTPAPRRRPATGPRRGRARRSRTGRPRPGRSATTAPPASTRRYGGITSVTARRTRLAGRGPPSATEVAVRRRPSARSPAPVSRARTCWSRSSAGALGA